ncbi:GNAT family N-acetyltransferase [Actinoplanes sp. NPDC051859]|uniref:GNAT family N-acetyltransferase n=1 Tax=Actinoplanes sp. NPDC051859 TaxID=3363909 RepID=UPI003798EE9E
MDHSVRPMPAAETTVVADMLDAFNREFDTPTPGPEVIAQRLPELIAGGRLAVLLTGEPAAGVAVISFRPNLWYDGPVALLDELYVRPELRGRRYGHALLEAACQLSLDRGADVLEINVDGEDVDARRFYEAHGFTNLEPGATEPMYFYYRELAAT